MDRTLPEPAIASTVRHSSDSRNAGDQSRFDRRLAELLADQFSAGEVQEALARGRRGGLEPDPLTQAAALPSAGKRLAAQDAAERVRAKFPGKLQLGRELLPHTAELPEKVALPAISFRGPDASGGPKRSVRGSARTLARQQRRVLVRTKRQDLERIARRFDRPHEAPQPGVWSRNDFRVIRAAVQDASGKAAECALYLLGTAQAAAMAAKVDTRVPMDRRRVALAYAIATAPGSELGVNVKLGFAVGLWSAVLADPSNPNMERGRRYRPSRRTLSDDLTWLQGLRVLKRWQVRAENAAPRELKTGQYPTNRYFAPQSRTGRTMLEIAMALRDVPPEVTPGTSQGWSEDDAMAMRLLREQLAAELAALPPPPLLAPT